MPNASQLADPAGRFIMGGGQVCQSGPNLPPFFNFLYRPLYFEILNFDIFILCLFSIFTYLVVGGGGGK